jgi:hypothetical protein
MSSVSRSEIHGFYESMGFNKHAKQAFVITAGFRPMTMRLELDSEEGR